MGEKHFADVSKKDTISRQAAIDALAKFVPYAICDESTESYTNGLTDAYNLICQLPSAQPEESNCEYCREDGEGYVTPLEKNGHAFVRFGVDGWELSLKANGWHGRAKIKFCPMCGRRLTEAEVGNDEQ